MALRSLLCWAGLAVVVTGCGPAGPTVIEFVSITPDKPRIGDVVTFRFRLLDSRGLPLAGQGVDFRLQAPREGVRLTPPSTQSIRGTGFAETQLVVSSRVNSVIVVATAGDKQVLSPPVTFAGTVPSGRQFTFQCGEISGTASGGRHAIGAYDPSRSLIAGVKIDCIAHTGDRNGDGVDGALVSFLVEAGTVGPSEVSSTDVIGNASILYKTTLPLPREVGPETFTWTPVNDLDHTGEYVAPLWMIPWAWKENPLDTTPVTLREPRRPDPIRLKPDGSGRFENNPRDNLATMIAVTTGEEGFTDSNNNGTYDPGEPFDDLTEPFVDGNDNGTWDPEERFIDTDGNGAWNGKNDQWDGSTLIWVQERLLWTGMPAPEDGLVAIPGVAGHRRVFAPIDSTPIRFRCPAGLPVGEPCYRASVDPTGEAVALTSAFLADPWFNTLARNDDADGCTLDVPGKAPVELAANSQFGIAFTYPAGEILTFGLQDARDPNLPPISQVPKRRFPIPFTVPISCIFTASPQAGHKAKVIVGAYGGDID